MNTAQLLLAAAAHGAGFGFHEKIIVGSTVIVVLVLILLGVIARSQIGIVPKGWGAAFEHVFDWIENMASDMIGAGARQYVPFLMSLFLFILISNWSGLLPLPVLTYGATEHSQGLARPSVDEAVETELQSEGLTAEQEHSGGENLFFEPPTASYNTTLALALISFLAFNWFGIKKQVFPKWGATPTHTHDDHHHHAKGGPLGLVSWIGHFAQPTPMLWASMEGGLRYTLVPLLAVLFICLNIVEEVARVLSLSLRLFGNISGEHQVKASLLGVMRAFLGQSLTGFQAGSMIQGPGWLLVSGLIFGASLFATLLGALAGFVQAMVFTMLSLVYIAHAVADDH